MHSTTSPLTETILPSLAAAKPALNESAGERLPCASPGSIEERSRWLGCALARRIDRGSQHPLAWLAEQGSGVAAGLDPAFQRRMEALVARVLGHSGAAGLPAPWKRVCGDVESILRWAWDQTNQWDDGLRETCLLKPLIPLYLSASTLGDDRRPEASQPAWNQTRQLLVELIGLVELHQSLEHLDFAQWLKHRGTSESDVRTTLRGSLNVDLHGFAAAMAERWVRENVPSNAPSVSSTATVSAIEHPSWWTMAWQWCHAERALLVPPGLPETGDAWSAWISHWKELYGLVSQEPHRAAARLIEVRAARDGQLGNCFEGLLENVRADQGILTLASVRYLGDTSGHPPSTEAIAWWQAAWLGCMESTLDAASPRGFVTDAGDFGLLYRDLDRTELAQQVRDALETMRQVLIPHQLLSQGQPAPLIAGIASVEGPARSFRMEQLMDASWRCLANAASQGPGTVKSIEVF